MNDKFDNGIKEINNSMKWDYSIIGNSAYLHIHDGTYNNKPYSTKTDSNQSISKFTDELMFNEKIEMYRFEVNLQIEDKKDFPIYFSKRPQ